MKRLFLSTFAVLALISLAAGVGIGASDDTAKGKLFSEEEYKAHLNFLAHDLLEGRAVGVRGGELAALYIATQFQAAGLKPISEEEGYFQRVPMVGITTDYETLRCSFSTGGRSIGLTPIEDLVVTSELTQDAINVEDELLFVGYGIDAPEYNWDDFKGMDVRGRVLVMLVNDPDYEKTGFGSESLTYYGRWTYKEEIARIKGAKGLIMLHTDESATYPFAVVQSSWAIERVNMEGEIKNPLALDGWASQPAFDKVLDLVGLSYAKLKEVADSREFVPFPLGITINVGFKQTYRRFTSPNVIGVLPGTSKADEAVVYMAHYDHLGVGREIDGDTIYNGAVDNASGTAAIICLAKAFASAPEPPKRSVIFLATTGEESGLLGSEYYSVHPVIPLEKTVIALNKDCCNFYGRRDGFGAFPIQFTDAVPAFEKLGEEMGLKLSVGGVDRGGGAFRVDNFPLCARGTVALSIGLSGNNLTLTEEQVNEMREKIGRWYHQPIDEVYPFWNYEGVMQEMEVLYQVGRYYADGGEKPSMKPENPFNAPIRVRNMKYVGEESK
jgi:hypothetical protein